MTAKIALVTGAGTGVGRAVALALAKAGYDVALAGRRVAVVGRVAGSGELLHEVAGQAVGVAGDEQFGVPSFVLERPAGSQGVDGHDPAEQHGALGHGHPLAQRRPGREGPTPEEGWRRC